MAPAGEPADVESTAAGGRSYAVATPVGYPASDPIIRVRPHPLAVAMVIPNTDTLTVSAWSRRASREVARPTRLITGRTAAVETAAEAVAGARRQAPAGRGLLPQNCDTGRDNWLTRASEWSNGTPRTNLTRASRRCSNSCDASRLRFGGPVGWLGTVSRTASC